MVWTDIPDFVNGVVITTEPLNQLKANVEYVRKPNMVTSLNLPTKSVNETGWVSLGAEYEKTIQTTGGHLMIWLTGPMRLAVNSSTHEGFVDFEVDGSRLGDVNRGLYTFGYNTNGAGARMLQSATLIRVLPNLPAGSHTVKVMVRVVGTGSRLDFWESHHFFIREL